MDKILQPCNYLNEITIKNWCPPYPLFSIFELLQGAIIFSKLDLRNYYHIAENQEEDEWRTAFNTASGHCEDRAIPFGLYNAPTVIQVLVKDVLRYILNHFLFIWMTFWFSLTETHISSTFERRFSTSWNILKKCEFHVSSLSFLVFIVSSDNIQTGTENVSAVAKFLVLYSRKQLQREVLRTFTDDSFKFIQFCFSSSSCLNLSKVKL